MSNSVDSFLERLQAMSPTTQKKKTFVKRRTIDLIYTNAKPNFGKYQLLPLPSVVNGSPYTVLQNTREIKMPRRNVLADGTEQSYSAWIKLLPKSAYTIKDPSTGREVSSLTAADESLLDQAYTVWEELFKELDVRNNVMNPNIGGLIRRKCYSIFFGRALSWWSNGDTRTPARQNFSGLFVVTSKSFLDIVSNSIADTNITSGMGNENWVNDIYNRDLTNRKGFIMFNISKSDSPGFNISVSHTLGAEQYLSGVTIPEEDAELMQNPVMNFLGWQANKEDESVPADQRRLFNKALITETIEYMTDLLAKARMAKQNGTSVEEAIAATNQTLLANQAPTDTHGQATNDPILADMARQASQAQPTGGYGNNNFVGGNGQDVAAKNTNPFQNPAAAHLDPLSGAPVAPGNGGFGGQTQSAPFQQPAFASGFGNGSNDLPF